MLLDTTIKKFKNDLLDINFDKVYDNAMENEYCYQQLLETTQMCLYVNDFHKNEQVVSHLVRMLDCILMSRLELEDRTPLSKPTLLHLISSLEKYSQCKSENNSPPKYMYN